MQRHITTAYVVYWCCNPTGAEKLLNGLLEGFLNGQKDGAAGNAFDVCWSQDRSLTLTLGCQHPAGLKGPHQHALPVGVCATGLTAELA